jgi:hypothetical protein
LYGSTRGNADMVAETLKLEALKPDFGMFNGI